MYRVYIRELNGVLYIKYLLYIHLVNNLYYTKPSLLPRIYIYYILLTYSIILLFQILLYSFMIYNYVTMTCDYDMWKLVIVIYDIMLTLISKSKNKKINENENENEKRSEK